MLNLEPKVKTKLLLEGIRSNYILDSDLINICDVVIKLFDIQIYEFFYGKKLASIIKRYNKERFVN